MDRLKAGGEARDIAKEFSLPDGVVVPPNSDVGYVLCWHHYDESGAGGVDGVGAVDDSGERIWLVVGNEALKSLDWHEILRDHGFADPRQTAFGYASEEPFAEGASIWTKIQDSIRDNNGESAQ